MTRIAFYLPQLAQNAAVRSTLGMATEIAERGVEVRILTDRRGGALETEFAGMFPLRSLDAPAPLAGPVLASAIHAEAPDIVVAVTTQNILAAALAKRLGLIRQPVFGWERERLSGGKLQTRLARTLYDACDKIIFATHSAAEDAAKLCAPRTLRTSVVYEPLPDVATTPLTSAEQEIVARLAAPRIVALGPLTRASDHLTLLRAFQFFARAKEGSLLVIGSGDQRGALESAVTGLGLGDRVVFASAVERPTNLLSIGHLFVSSALADTTGLGILQALALGVPVVAADSPTAPREILADGRYGRLAPPGDPRALWHAMREAVETTHYRPMLRARAEEFSTARAADAFLNALDAEIAANDRGQKAA